MLEAATLGYLEYRDAGPNEAMWWRSIRARVSAYVRYRDTDRYAQLYRMTQTHTLSQIPLVESPSKVIKRSHELFSIAFNILFPFDKLPSAEDFAVTMKGQWEARFGKLEDAETQAKIKATVDWLNEHNIAFDPDDPSKVTIGGT